MKTLFVSLLLIGSMTLKAQTKIELTDVSKHVGDSVIVKGKVFGLKEVDGGRLLLINLGGAYPKELLTIVLQKDVQKVLAEPLKGELQEIAVAGKIELFKTKPQIVVSDPTQIQSIITEKAAAQHQGSNK